MMSYSPNLLKLIDEFEGNKLEAYPDPRTGGDPWTAGRGHTGVDVHEGTTITEEQSLKWFEEDSARFVALVNQAVKVPLTQNQFDALVSIVYNVGPGSRYKDGILMLTDGRPSTLLRMLNTFDYEGAAAQFLVWISPGTSVTHGLLRRRTAERQLFLQQ